MQIIIWREWFNNKLYPLLFSLCLAVSLGAFLTLDALQQSVNAYVNDNQKQIVGGDIIITDNQPWSEDILSEINQLNSDDVVFDYQFNAIAYTDNDSILTRIKAVSSAYPLYGDLILSGNTNPWKKGSVLVEQQILSSLNVTIGDTIQIGESHFIIHDEIITEPDRPLTAFGFGARVIMHDTDLKQTQLLGKKSRVNYRIEIRSEAIETPILFDKITSIINLDLQAKTTIKTAEQSNTSLSNLSQNFLVFLKLLVVAVILLSGIGVMSIVSAFVAKQRDTNAIRSALGERSQPLINSYRILFSLMALFSVALAWLLSQSVLHFGKDVFSAILPNNIDLSIDLFSVVKAIIIALLLTALMTYFTLNSIRKIKPIAVLHKHQLKQKLSKKPWIWILFTCLSAFLLIYSELLNFLRSLQIFVGIIIIWFVFSLLSKLLLSTIKWLLDKRLINQWMIVLALQNIFRKDNHSSLFITVLSLTTMILGTIKILDYSIQQQLISTYPEDAPNLFFLDIQTDQQETLDTLVGESLTYYPVVRARVDSVNGVSTDILKDTLGNYDRIGRIFNLSYATSLLPTEELLSSVNNGQLFSELDETDANGYKAMSILESFANFLEVDLGDEVIFNIQGIKIKTKITSIRKRLKRGPSPFFYFIFPPEVLQDAPQIRFATAKVSDENRVKIQTSVAKALPGITTLDGGNIAKKLKEFTDQLKQMVEIFTALSLFAGLLIFITSLVSTSQDRLKESFYYRMMGMLGRDLLKLTAIEFLALGLFAFNLGVIIAAIISALITKYWFALSFIFPWQVFLISITLLIITLLTISIIYTNYVKKTKVTNFLRYE
jgi:putative ABC transport system permease protein